MVKFPAELDWTTTQMPLLVRALDALPDLTGMRLACSMHLDIKMAPFVSGLVERGAAVYLTTCNPRTVRNEVVDHLAGLGAAGRPRLDMSEKEVETEIQNALDWEPTHLCEMGADLSVALHARASGCEASRRDVPAVRAALEATGTGIARLAGRSLRYPVFNWDDIAVKEGLHNRHMVGICTWNAFFDRTHLTLHGKRVLVVGFGLVGRGLADTAQAFGGAVTVVERDVARRLEAQYAGFHVSTLAEAVRGSDIVVTATGVSGLLSRELIELLPEGAFLLNASHVNDEIDVKFLRGCTTREVMPHVESCEVAGKTIYLFAGGAMANLTAGQGDSLNAFQITLAVMTAGIAHIASEGAEWPAGLHPLPVRVWRPFIDDATTPKQS